jgi:hypothetical protein
MTARTWNLKLMATDEHPEMTVEGLSQEAATNVLRGLMHGDIDREQLNDVPAARADRHEAPLAA